MSDRLRDATGSALRTGLEQLVRRNLRGVWLRGSLPLGGCVWASNHHTWWDFFVAAAAFRTANRSDVGVLMQAENKGRPSLFSSVGAVGTDQLRTAVSMVADGKVLVVFPEGELRAAGPLGPIRSGAAWIAGRAEAPLLPVATRVVLRGQQAPEAYLWVGDPVPAGEALADVLGAQLSGLDADLAAADPEQPPVGYRQLVAGVRSWNERFGALQPRNT